MKILIAVDGSQGAEAAAQAAARLAKPENREIDLLCVAPAHTRRDRNRKSYERRILEETTQILEKTRTSIGPLAASVRLLTEIGSPAAAIAQRAPDYDLTVIGAKGWGTNPNTGLGPVASRVAENSLGAVLIGRDLKADADVRILVAVDGSTASLRAIETLQEIFDLASKEICLMHVTETPWVQLGLEEDWVSASEEEQERSEAGAFQKELVREGDEILEEARIRLAPSLAAVSTRIDEGNPANEILSEAERGQYDLIVIGATGNRDLKHQMLGSVSARIAWDAPCSVLLVREPEEV